MPDPVLEWYDSPTDSGPLKSLSSINGTVALQYPRDLGSKRKSHTVRFDIKRIKHTPVSKIVDDAKGAYDTLAGVTNTLGSGVATALESGGISAAGSKLISNFQSLPNIPFSFPTAEEENIGYVELYTPDDLTFGYNAEYDGTSLAKIIGDATEKISGTLASGINSLTQGDTSRLIMSRFGYAFNPQQQMLFQGINFRTYSLSFTFTPYSEQEANQIKNIIKEFRKHAAPSTIEGSAGFFYEPPSVFDITFRFDGSENESINKVQRSVLENVEVNYASQGWSSFSDGNPVQTTMVLSFKEIVLLDRNKISESW